MNFISLKEKAEILCKTIISLREIYKDATENQKQLLETMVGASIFYLPKSKNLWSGYISQEALTYFTEDKNFNKRCTMEHSFPRKEAGRELLSNNEILTVEKLADLYINKYGVFNWVSKSENNRLKEFQKKGIFINQMESYKNANIKLIKISSEQLMKIKK